MRVFPLFLLVNLSFALFRILYVLFYPIDLSPEEAQYWDWSRHLDLSYYSKPPMVAYLNFLSTSLLGNTELGVRITPIVMSFLLSVGVFLFLRRLFDERVAFVASTFPNILVGTAINSLLMTTDAPLVFFWGLAVMSIYFAVERNSAGLWLLVGVFAGLAFLSKYPAVFLLPLTLLYMYLVRRSLLLSYKPYLSLIPAFLLSLPVLVWNFERDFVSFRHVSNLADRGANFPNLASFGEFLGGQLLLLSVFPFFLMVYGWWRAFVEKDKRLVFLTVYSLPVVVFFGALALRKTVYANWAGFGYFAGALLASIFLYRLWNKNRVLALGVLGFSAFLTLLLHFTPLIDHLGMRNFLPPKRDPVKVMIGWEKLGREVSKFYTGDELVFSTRYQISAELAFYVEGNPRTFVFHTGRMTQYYLWRKGLKDYRGKDAIFVSEHELPEKLRGHFSSSRLLEKVEVLWRGEVIRRFYIYRLHDFRGEFDESPRGY